APDEEHAGRVGCKLGRRHRAGEEERYGEDALPPGRRALLARARARKRDPRGLRSAAMGGHPRPIGRALRGRSLPGRRRHHLGMPRTLFDRPDHKVRLDDLSAEPPKGMTREKAELRLAELGEELFALQDEMFASKASSVLVVLQGRDTAGKDGTIKHVAGYL